MNETEFRPTHVTPLDGLPTWSGPDPSQPSAWLDALLPVRLAERRGDWARVVCSNGWAAWVDGRLLIAVPDAPPGTGNPMARASDPRPLLARLEQTVAAYRQLVEQLAEGRIDLETFRRRGAGLRTGVVVDGESAWILDLDHDRWWYCHATQLQTFATVPAPPDAGRHAAGAAHDDEHRREGAAAEPPPASTSVAPTRASDL
jgi:hypothetical protein